jgi:MYXO-CTERM domain-containing protein
MTRIAIVCSLTLLVFVVENRQAQAAPFKCTMDSDCAPGRECIAGACCSGGVCDNNCNTSDECSDGPCDTSVQPGVCVECMSDADCDFGSERLCDLGTRICVECKRDADCSNPDAFGPLCDTRNNSNSCVECLSDADCPLEAPSCENSGCNSKSCASISDCPAGTECTSGTCTIIISVGQDAGPSGGLDADTAGNHDGSTGGTPVKSSGGCTAGSGTPAGHTALLLVLLVGGVFAVRRQLGGRQG